MAEPTLPPIEYPVLYTFRFVVKQEADVSGRIRQLVEGVMGALSDESVLVRPGKGGNFVAVHVSCLLVSEEQRRAVYAKVQADPAVVLSL
jgi:putative lipoic acid-binding regulatory protein